MCAFKQNSSRLADGVRLRAIACATAALLRATMHGIAVSKSMRLIPTVFLRVASAALDQTVLKSGGLAPYTDRQGSPCFGSASNAHVAV